MDISEKVLCITFHDEMDAWCKEVLNELEIQIPTLIITDRNEQTILKDIERWAANGLEIIISRGILADIIRCNNTVKVLEISIPGEDVLAALYPFAGQDVTIACVECPAFCEVVRDVADILGLRVRYYTVSQLKGPGGFFAQCKQAESDGADVIVGGAWGVLFPEDVRKQYIPIEPSKKAMKASIQDALVYFRLLCEEKKKKHYLDTLLDHSEEGIISVDHEGRITRVNASATRMLSVKDYRQLKGREVGELFEQYRDKSRIINQASDRDSIICIGDKKLMLSRMPILLETEVTGAIFFLSEASRVQEAERRLRLETRKKGLTAKHSFDSLETRNQKMREIVLRAQKYSSMEATILLLGETGCGKEFFAQAIHNAGFRAAAPFVAVNCAALPSNLLESALFGYAPGAFTGANREGKAGIFEIAHKGTIFLDEIGEIDLTMQAHLLRVIQEKEVMRIGDDKVIPVDVRIIAATNRNLKKEVTDGKFRMDLFYRLNVLSINIPPLRQRSEDIEPLTRSLIKEKNSQLKCNVTGVDAETVEAMTRYDWPGNIRELSNAVEVMVSLTQYGMIEYSAMSSVLPDIFSQEETVSACSDATLKEMERRCIKERLRQLDNNKTRTAKSLGIGQATLFRKIKEYNITT